MTCNASSSDPPGAASPCEAASFDVPAPRSGPVLVLCAVEEEPCVVLAASGRVLASRSGRGASAAMSFLAPAVAGVLAESGTSPRDLGGVACVRGPGSFTGIRVGLALAEGLRLGTDAPLWGLDALPLVARRALALRPRAGCAAVAMHARRGLVYFQAFAALSGAGTVAPPQPCGPALVLAAGTAARTIAESLPGVSVGDVAVAGTGLRNNREAFAAVLPEACLLPDEAAFPDAGILAAAATGPGRDAPRPAEAAYLRPSDAEENLAAIARDRGLDPRTAGDMLRAALSSRVS